MSIDLAQLRDALATELDDRVHVDHLSVYPRGVDGTFQAPAIVLGQPDVEYDVAPCGIHRYTLGVAVVVARPGIDEVATQQQLEDAWQAVEAALFDVIEHGVLDRVARVDISLTRSTAGSFLNLQGQSYPAQELTLELIG